jgi:hypothetical protein
MLSRSARYRRVLESLSIRDESGQIVPMRFSPSQDILWSYVAPALDRHERIWAVVLKGRQVYSTTFWSGLVFARTLERANTNSLVIAHELDTSREIFGKTLTFYEHLALPKIAPPRVKVLEFPFPDGQSKIQVTSAGRVGKGHGTTQTCILGSEVAYWVRPEVLSGIFQTIPGHVGDTIWVLESTANGMTGMGGPFYEEWKAAVDGRSDLLPIFVPYFIMPKYRRAPGVPESEWEDEEKELVRQFQKYGFDGETLSWRRATINTRCQGSAELFRQYYPATPEEAFIFSGLPAFDRMAILRQQQNVQDPALIGEMIEGKFFPKAKGWVKVWRKPEDGHSYVIGVDTAAGVRGGDYACGQVLDMSTLEQVATIHGYIEPWEMAKQLAPLGRWYNRALVAVELQGNGRSVQDYLIRVYQYPHLHPWRGRQDSIVPTAPKLYGWETNVQTRPLLIDAGRRAINAGLVILHDRGTLDEITHFSRTDTGRYEAEMGHDDRVLALLIALRSREENFPDATPHIINPYELNDLPAGLRVLTPAEDMTRVRARSARVAADRAKTAAKNWLRY